MTMPKTFVIKTFVTIKRFSSNCSAKKKRSACDLIKIAEKCVAHNYCPPPVVINRGRGVYVYDVDGKKYLDFLSGYAAVSLGHSHPRIYKAVCDQARILTHTSRAFFTKALAEYGEYITELFCYDKVLPMNTGNDACETAVKLARKWGYRIKGIPSNQAKVLFAENNFWGRSIAAISASTTPESSLDYGPFVSGFDTVPFSDIEALSVKIKDPNVCAFMIEPVQGEAGVIIPDPCYLKQVRDLCNQNKVLLIADEVQCGLGRSGCMLCCDIYKVRPDILVLGKALSAGFSPVSAVLADAEIMDVIEPKTHGSTYGGNALGCVIAMEALQTLKDENLIENARTMGELLRGALCDLPRDIICEVRGVGLLNALVFHPGIDTENVSLDMVNNGLLVTTARDQIIRLCPPLIVREKDIMKAARIIRHCVENSRGTCGGDDGGEKFKFKIQKKVKKLSNYMEIKCPKCSFKLPKKISESLGKLCPEKISSSNS